MIKQFIAVCITGVIAASYCFYVGGTTTLFAGVPSFWVVAGLLYLIQIIASIPAIIFQTEKFYDLVGGMSFVVGAMVCTYLQPEINFKQLVGLSLTSIWATRMALFLFFRVMKVGQDSRFKDIKIHGQKFFVSWWIQALWIVLTAGPVYIMILNKSKDSQLGVKQIIGIVLFVVGFLIQVISDQQKIVFKLDPKTKNKFITHGLWKFSRHPNFCGDIMVWIGLSLYCLDSLHGYERYACIISPVFTYILLTKIAGVDMLEQSADKKWGGKKDYQQYKRTTPVLFPGMGTGKNAKPKQK